MFKKGRLIDKLSLDTKVFRKSSTTNEMGSEDSTYSLLKTCKMYITSNMNSGSRSDVANKYDAIQEYTAQTTKLNLGIKINDLLEQNGQTYRIIDIDENAANTSIEAEYTLVRIGDLQDKLKS